MIYIFLFIIINNKMIILFMLLLKIINLNLLNLRNNRQNLNNKLVYNEIINGKINEKNINNKKFIRIINELNISKEEILQKCKNDIYFAKLLSINISKISSQQGNKDEYLQLYIINKICNKCNIYINNIEKYRPTKDGKIISEKEYKTNKISKLDCLKTFDAKITGKINGWIFAKVVIGNGGHQDNVFQEAIYLCDWVIKNKIYNEYFFILIDTDMYKRFNEISQKYNNITPFLIVCNHITIQEYFINNFYNKKN